MKSLLSLLCSAVFALSAWGADNQLNLFIWSEYIDPEVVKDFEKQFNCKVVIDLYEDEAAMMTKIQGGGDSLLHDVVVPPDHKVTALVKQNLLAPLRHENIPNLKNLDERFRSPAYDRGNKYTVTYQWGTLGLYIRKARGTPPEPTWGLILDPKKSLGRFVMLDNMRDLIGVALKYKGYSINSTNAAQLKEARDLLISAKKRCSGFENTVGGKNKILGKAVKVAVVYNGEAARGMSEDKNTDYIIPKEGSQIWQDNLAVLAKAPHRDLAEKFINYVLDGEVSARISNFTQFATPNKAAMPHINADDLKNPAIYPPSEVMAKLEFLEDLGTQTRLYNEIWTQIKSK